MIGIEQGKQDGKRRAFVRGHAYGVTEFVLIFVNASLASLSLRRSLLGLCTGGARPKTSLKLMAVAAARDSGSVVDVESGVTRREVG